MENIKINLVKRNAKLLLYILAGMLCTFAVIAILAHIFTQGFSWFALIFGIIFFFGEILIFSNLYTYFTSKEVSLVVESDGKTITFYNINNLGKVFNKSEEVNLADMGKFYLVKTRTRYFMNNYAYAFEKKGASTSIFKTDIDAFPSLFEATEEDRNKVLAFVKIVCPEISLGYESSWEKATKNKKA